MKRLAIPLAQAQIYALRIVSWLNAFCERIEICGSIRREQYGCGDIDLVVIPKCGPAAKDLLGNIISPPVNYLRAELVQYVEESKGRAYWRRGDGAERGDPPKTDGVNFLLRLPKCDLDVFCATRETFVTRQVCRTGSIAHNIFMCERAKSYGGHWNPSEGLTLPAQGVTRRTPLCDERDFYDALELPYIEPFRREARYLERYKALIDHRRTRTIHAPKISEEVER